MNNFQELPLDSNDKIIPEENNPSTESLSISKESGNQIIEKDDGIYVPKCDIGISAKDDNQLQLEQDGLFVAKQEANITYEGDVTLNNTYTGKIQLSDMYSTDEKIVGSYTNGKPLYSKTLSITDVGNKDQYDTYVIDTSKGYPQNVENIIDVKGFVLCSGHKRTILNINVSEFAEYAIGYIVQPEVNRILISVGNDQAIDEAYIAIFYTKTTDNKNTFKTDMLETTEVRDVYHLYDTIAYFGGMDVEHLVYEDYTTYTYNNLFDNPFTYQATKDCYVCANIHGRYACHIYIDINNYPIAHLVFNNAVDNSSNTVVKYPIPLLKGQTLKIRCTNGNDERPNIAQTGMNGFIVYPVQPSANMSSDPNPTGTIISYMGNSAPAGYLICDGTVYNISQYPVLAQHINYHFGSYGYFGGDGTTTFAVPDLRGEFLRGTGTATRDSGSGASVGEHQESTRIPHLRRDGNSMYIMATVGDNVYSPTYVDAVSSTKGVFYAPKGGVNRTNDYIWDSWFTARPTNTSILYCIKI